MKAVYETKYLRLEIDEAKKLMVQSWIRYCSTEEFRDGQLKTVGYFKDYDCKYFVSDATKAGVLKKEDTDWAAKEVIPMLAKEGMEVLNFVMPESFFAKLALQNLEQEKPAGPVEIKYHQSLQAAIAQL